MVGMRDVACFEAFSTAGGGSTMARDQSGKALTISG